MVARDLLQSGEIELNVVTGRSRERKWMQCKVGELALHEDANTSNDICYHIGTKSLGRVLGNGANT